MGTASADLGDPTVAAMRRNAEAAARDDAQIIKVLADALCTRSSTTSSDAAPVR